MGLKIILKFIKKNFYWVAFLSIMLIKYGFYNFRYYPVIDDWIQYGCFSLIKEIFKEIIIGTGTYTTRPLASLSDPYIWAQFWGNMWITFLIITLLHFVSGYLLYKVFEYNKLNVGLIFLIIFGLLPLGTEATYWISASSRLVAGIFFMALSLYLLSLLIHKNYKNYKNRIILVLFFITNLTSLGYYESIIVLSVFGSILMILLNWKLLKNKWIVIIPFINFSIIGLYYRLFDHVEQATSRVQYVKSDYFEHFAHVFDKITDVWGRAHIPLYTRGLIRGINELLNNGAYFYLFLIFLFTGIAAFLAFKEKDEADIKNHIIKIVLGGALFWVPYSINFILENVWISNRNAFTSFIGLGLIVEGAIYIVISHRLRKYIKGLVIAVLVPVFIIINISEITDYKNVSETDKLICTNIVNAAQGTGFWEGKTNAILFNTFPVYVEQNMYYHEHINNVTVSDWALTGCVMAVSRNRNVRNISPVANEQIFSLDDDITSLDLFGMDSSMDVFPLSAEEINNDIIVLKRNDGKIFGFVERDGQHFKFEK